MSKKVADGSPAALPGAALDRALAGIYGDLVLPGEATQKAGDDGVRRARRYLESTTRVKTAWLVTDPLQASMMTFAWPHAKGQFSFDIGGIFHGGDIDGQRFAAESKAYKNNNNHQDAEYKEFLAGCYYLETQSITLYHHYLWLTTHPFSVDNWSRLCTAHWVTQSVVRERTKVLGVSDEDAAREQVDPHVAEAVASKLWLIAIPDRHEELSITDADRGLVFERAAKERRL